MTSGLLHPASGLQKNKWIPRSMYQKNRLTQWHVLSDDFGEYECSDPPKPGVWKKLSLLLISIKGMMHLEIQARVSLVTVLRDGSA